MDLFEKHIHCFSKQLILLTGITCLIWFLVIVSCDKIQNTPEENTSFKEDLEKKVFSRNFSADSILYLLDSYVESKNNTAIYGITNLAGTQS